MISTPSLDPPQVPLSTSLRALPSKYLPFCIDSADCVWDQLDRWVVTFNTSSKNKFISFVLCKG